MQNTNTTNTSAETRSVREEFQQLLPEKKDARIAWFAFAAVFVWFYWSTFHYLVASWMKSEDYQHGWVVPFFVLWLLWIRRDKIPKLGATGTGTWWGLPLLALWAVMRWTAVYFNYGTLPELSMLPFFAGTALLVGGWQGLVWSWPAILFMFFMIPLPGAIQGMASEQLQALATRLSTYTIQTLGIAAIAEGNVIQLAERPLEVARACSGLRMMMLFFALCIGAAFVVQRPLWEKLVMIASAAPIAVASNVVRIVMTAVIYHLATYWPTVIDLDSAGELIHEWAGYLMMPVGLLLLLVEMTLLSKLMIAPTRSAIIIGPLAAEHGATERVFQKRRR
jgi:exosortase